MSRILYKRLIQLHLLGTPKSLKSFTTTSPTPPPISFTTQYLINSCGLPLQTALSKSKELNLDENNPNKPDSVLNFFKSHGFSNTHIAELITKRPMILHSRVDENLKPKIEFLLDMGFSGSNLLELILSNPIIFGRSLRKHLKPCFDFLMTFVKTNNEVISMIRRAKWLLTYDLKRTMEPNITLLIIQGVPISNLSNLIKAHPRALMQKVCRMVIVVETLKKWGFKPKVPSFLHAIRVKLSMSESTWERKLEVFKSVGFSEEEVICAFKRDPIVIACSEEKIKNVMDFYVNTMKLEPSIIISYPKLLMYGLDTRIRPRYVVLKLLKSKSLLKKDRKIVWALTRTEKEFLDFYVLKNMDEIPNLLNIYRGAIIAKDTKYSRSTVSII